MAQWRSFMCEYVPVRMQNALRLRFAPCME